METRISIADVFGSVNPKHSSKTVEHYTPKKYIEAVHQVLGNISLDPASNAIANETVGATQYYTKEVDGLTRRWYSNVFCNPPGGKVANKSVPKLFWDKLIQERSLGNINHAIFLAFSIEALQTCQKGVIQPMGNFPICIPDHRISFVNAEGQPLAGNTHASCFVYVPGQLDMTYKFAQVFSQFGIILNKR